MGDPNYLQILGVQKLGKNLDLSAEFDTIQSVDFTREAFRWQRVPIPVAPDLTLEAITRLSDNRTFGWSGNLGRNVDKKGHYRAGMFYSDVPAGMFLREGAQFFWNGDSYALGKRVGPTFRLVPFKDFDITLFGSDRLDRTPGTRYRVQATARYQFAGLLNRSVH